MKNTLPLGSTEVELQEAVNNAAAGDIIEIQNSITLSAAIDIPDGKRLTLQSNSKETPLILTITVTTSTVDLTQGNNSSTVIIDITGPRDQAIADIIESVALQEAALARVLNAEGAKIQTMVAMKNVSFEELMTLNKSATSLLSSVSKLEMMFHNKLGRFTTDC